MAPIAARLFRLLHYVELFDVCPVVRERLALGTGKRTACRRQVAAAPDPDVETLSMILGAIRAG